jgi:hypothetical protein
MQLYLKFILLSILLQGSLLALNVSDGDFDGVSDEYDECPNTPFSDLVDSRGCSIKKVPIARAINKLTVIAGVHYSNYDAKYNNNTKTLSQSLELDYQIKKIKLMLYISRFSSKNKPFSKYDDSSFSDTRLSFLYTLDRKIQNLGISLGAGIAIPNYKGSMHNNSLDVYTSINSNYSIDKTSLFASYIFTKIGDSDVGNLKYQNTSAISLGVGYLITPKFYSSLSLYLSDPIVKSGTSTKNLSLYSYYNLSQKKFLSLSYSHDLVKEINSNSYGVNMGFRL